MSNYYSLIAEVDAQKAKMLPNHIVVSAEIVNPEMAPKQLEQVCQSLVDTFFHCLVTKVNPGIYLPPEDDEKQESVAAKTTTTTSDEDESSSERNKLIKQSGGKQAIVNAMQSHLEEEFLPFLMQAMDTMPKQKKEDDDEGDSAENKKEESSTKKKSTPALLPQVGCVFNKRGEMISMGSLSTCGAGIGGIFMNGVY